MRFDRWSMVCFIVGATVLAQIPAWGGVPGEAIVDNFVALAKSREQAAQNISFEYDLLDRSEKAGVLSREAKEHGHIIYDLPSNRWTLTVDPIKEGPKDYRSRTVERWDGVRSYYWVCDNDGHTASGAPLKNPGIVVIGPNQNPHSTVLLRAFGFDIQGGSLSHTLHAEPWTYSEDNLEGYGPTIKLKGKYLFTLWLSKKTGFPLKSEWFGDGNVKDPWETITVQSVASIGGIELPNSISLIDRDPAWNMITTWAVKIDPKSVVINQPDIEKKLDVSYPVGTVIWDHFTNTKTYVGGKTHENWEPVSVEDRLKSVVDEATKQQKAGP